MNRPAFSLLVLFMIPLATLCLLEIKYKDSPAESAPLTADEQQPLMTGGHRLPIIITTTIETIPVKSEPLADGNTKLNATTSNAQQLQPGIDSNASSAELFSADHQLDKANTAHQNSTSQTPKANYF